MRAELFASVVWLAACGPTAIPVSVHGAILAEAVVALDVFIIEPVTESGDAAPDCDVLLSSSPASIAALRFAAYARMGATPEPLSVPPGENRRVVVEALGDTPLRRIGAGCTSGVRFSGGRDTSLQITLVDSLEPM